MTVCLPGGARSDSSPSLNAMIRTPEDCLLLCCASVHSEHQASINELLAGDLQWNLIFETARHHKMMPILYWCLKDAEVPREIMARLKAEFNRNVLRNMRLTAELLRLLELFRSRSIPAISLKGPVLAVQVYGDVALRHFVDLDILVGPEDVAGAKEILLEQGYVPYYQLSPGQESAFLKSEHHHHFTHPRLGMVVELHWRLSPVAYSSSQDVMDLFDRACSIRILGKEALSLSREDTLCHVSAHGTRHYWHGLSMACDMARIIEAGGIDWPLAVKYARDAGDERSLMLGLLLAGDILDAPVPLELMEMAVASRAVVKLASQVGDRVLSCSRPKVGDRASFWLRSRQNAADTARLLRYVVMVPSPDDWAEVSLPGGLSFAYNLVRPFRLFKNHVLNPLFGTSKEK